MFSIGAPVAAMTHKRRRDRTIDELIGLCRGLIADGDVNQAEVRFLERWLIANQEFRSNYPISTLYERVMGALEDGVLDEDEEHDILAMVHDLAGGEVPAIERATSASSRLPLCDPPPCVAFDSRVFLVTGVFDFGPRSTVARAILDRGGAVSKGVSRKVNYLVVGNIGSRDWLHSSYGTKIERVIALREQGRPVNIVSEAHWARHL